MNTSYLAVRIGILRVHNQQRENLYKAINRRYAKLGLVTYRPIRMPSKQKASFEQANVIEEAKFERDLRPSRPSVISERTRTEIQLVDETKELLVEKNPIDVTVEDGQQSRAESKKSSQTVNYRIF